MSVSGSVNLTVNMNDQRSIGINSSANIPCNFAPNAQFANGSGALQVANLFQNQFQLSSGVYTLALTGVLTDSYGTPLNLVRVKGFLFQNNSILGNSMTIGAGASPWATFLNGTGTMTLPAGAAVCAFTPDATGWTVTATTGMDLHVTGTGTDTFTFIVFGSTT